MEFRIQRKENENLHKYPTEDLAIARKFTDQLKKELQDFLVGVVAFGSSVRRETTDKSDIDILVVIDDVGMLITEAVIEGYRLIIENLVCRTSLKLHITSMTYSSFWEHAKAGDPILVNMLRDGIALYDTGFFTPLQLLLKQGRII